MARDTIDNTPIESYDQLVNALTSGCKPKQKWRIGTEHEKFGFFGDDLTPVFYEQKNGIATLLESMKKKTGWQSIMDGDKIIGLAAPDGGGAISLEPGGQFELSGAPLETVHQTCAESQNHLALLKEVCEPFGMGFLGVGASPKWTLDETPKMPKSRYDIMRAYMPKVGTQGLDMMHRTCTIQVNLDFSDETDMRRKMIVATKLQSVASALFAASPFTDSKPNGLLSWRCEIWKDTDNQRAGLHKFMTEDSFGFQKYVDWALDVPMYFIRRNNAYVDCTHITFRQFWKDNAIKDEVDDYAANEGDWVNHLSTLFPDVRLKSFLEMRGADGGPWSRICALPAFWVGLLYDSQSLDAAEQIANELEYEDVVRLRDEVPTKGLDAKSNNVTIKKLAESLLDIARKGLENRNILNEEGHNEAHFLDPLNETLLRNQTLAQQMLNKYHGEWKQDINKIFGEYAY